MTNNKVQMSALVCSRAMILSPIKSALVFRNANNKYT